MGRGGGQGKWYLHIHVRKAWRSEVPGRRAKEFSKERSASNLLCQKVITDSREISCPEGYSSQQES